MASGSDDADPEPRRVRWREWFLLNGRRHLVFVVALVALFWTFTLLVMSGLVPLGSTQPLFYLFGGLISGNLTVITVVVAINQLLLSQEFYTPNELESQMEGIVDYREGIRDAVDQVPPVEPLGFLRLLVESSREEAQSLGGLAFTEAGGELHDELEPIVTDLTAKADEVDALLQRSDPSTFDVLSTTLATNYSKGVNRLRRILYRHDRLPEDVAGSIETLIHHLEDIDVARQYFKTIYLQEELASLSKQLFYVGLASLAVVSTGLLLLTSSAGASVPPRQFALVVPGLITAGFAPITLLFVYILRIATVSKRTAAIMPFTTPAQEG